MKNNEVTQIVLISGLINIHKWSKDFIRTLVDTWGSENVFIVYTNKGTKVKKHNLNGKIYYSIGPNNYRSGADSVREQADRVSKKIRILQENYGLKQHFHIIGHSMGGLVARQFIYDNPNTVHSLVALGTPNHGSPLANFYKWLSYIIGAKKAFDNLTPEWVKEFNERCPLEKAPLYQNGKIYTVRGYTPRNPLKNIGVIGEVFFAWLTLRYIYKVKSDGLVPEDSVLAKGAEHLVDFPNYHHLHLARRSDVAKIASSALLNSSNQSAQVK